MLGLLTKGLLTKALPLPSLPMRAIGILLVALALVAFGWVKGNEHGTQKLIDYQGAQAKAAVKIAAAQGAVTTRVEVRVRERIRIVREAGETIVKEVPVYVTPEADAACAVTRGFVRLHNAAAAGEIPGPPGLGDGAAGGVALSAVAATVVHNYATALGWREQLLGCQAWIREQQAIEQ
ncbi:MAG: hypothetical protein ROZ00_05010 [Denitratisoma sp.]|nr:hypothetical protein [Denitratisoma sp.]